MREPVPETGHFGDQRLVPRWDDPERDGNRQATIEAAERPHSAVELFDECILDVAVQILLDRAETPNRKFELVARQNESLKWEGIQQLQMEGRDRIRHSASTIAALRGSGQADAGDDAPPSR